MPRVISNAGLERCLGFQARIEGNKGKISQDSSGFFLKKKRGDKYPISDGNGIAILYPNRPQDKFYDGIIDYKIKLA